MDEKEALKRCYRLLDEILDSLKPLSVTDPVQCGECFEIEDFTYETVDESKAKDLIKDFKLFNGFEIERMIT